MAFTLIVTKVLDPQDPEEFFTFEPDTDMAQTIDEFDIGFWREDKAGNHYKTVVPWSSVLYAIEER